MKNKQILNLGKREIVWSKKAIAFSSILSLIVQASMLGLFVPQIQVQASAPELSCAEGSSHLWQLEESGSPYLDSVLANQNDATCVIDPIEGTDCPTKIDGLVGNAQLFDGVDDELNVADDDTFDWASDSSFTMEYWMKTAEVPSVNGVIIGRDDPAPDSLHMWTGIRKATSKAQFCLFDTSNDGVCLIDEGGITLSDDNWHHVVAMKDNSTNENRIYVDGTLAISTTYIYSSGFGSAQALNMNIGYLNLSPGYHYNGALDEVALWNRALTPGEIQSHYDNGIGGLNYCSVEPEPELNCDNPVKIMPLGDSITKGNSSGPVQADSWVSYRKYLLESLNNAGSECKVDFVGHLEYGGDDMDDPDNEGNGGVSDAWMAENVYNGMDNSDSGLNILNENDADVILLHIGTNELNASADDVEDILEEIDEYEVDTGNSVTVILALIINRLGNEDPASCSNCQLTSEFNDNVKIMAQARIDNDGDDIIIVDMEKGAGIDYRQQPIGDMFDTLHPFATGYAKMATLWHNALATVLPQCNPLPPTIISTPVTEATVGQPYTYDVEAVGFSELFYELIVKPIDMAIDADGLIEWLPGATGLFDVTVEVSNNEGTDSQDFAIDVVESLSCSADMSHYWQLNDITSGFYEDSFNGNDGVCSGFVGDDCPTPTDSAKVNWAQFFDGDNSGIDVSADSSFDWEKDDSFSIMLWMKGIAGQTCAGTGSSNNEVIVGRDDTNTSLHWWLGCRNTTGDVHWQLGDKDGNYAGITGPSISDGEWHHLVAIHDGNNDKILLYVDGVFIDSVDKVYAAGFDSASAPLTFGHLLGSYHYEGILDEIAIYNRVLSSSEIGEHYDQSLNGGYYCEEPEPICGNEIEEKGEQCDDGNLDNGDGCSITCEEEKVIICHIPPENSEAAGTIEISQSEVEAHLAHGDNLGECAVPELGPGDYINQQDCEEVEFYWYDDACHQDPQDEESECADAAYVFEADLSVVGNSCHPSNKIIDSMFVDVDEGSYRVEVKVNRGNPTQCQTNESFYLAINGQDSLVVEDDIDACVETVAFEGLGIFNFIQGSNEIVMNTAAQCPPDTHANSVEVSKVCLYLDVEGPECGNEIKEEGEQCDDGNVTDGDGCSAQCLIDEPEPTPPAISGGGGGGYFNPGLMITNESIASTTDITVLITWLTNKVATSRIVYDTVSHPALGDAPNYGYLFSTPVYDESPKVTFHSVTIEGLLANTDYYYRAISAASPEKAGQEFAFVTSLSLENGEIDTGQDEGDGTDGTDQSDSSDLTTDPTEESTTSGQEEDSTGTEADVVGPDEGTSDQPEIGNEPDINEATDEEADISESDTSNRGFLASIGSLFSSSAFWMILIIAIIALIILWFSRKRQED